MAPRRALGGSRMGAEKTISARCDNAIALLLAGGSGKRLQPLTLRRTKPLMPFGGVLRLIDVTLENCLRSGLRRVALLTQGKSEAIYAHVGNAWKSRLSLLSDQGGETDASNKGTADAVGRALRLVQKAGAENIFVLASDHVYRMDYRRMLQFHQDCGAAVTVGAVEMPLASASAFGVMETGSDGKVLRFVEKPVSAHALPSRPAAALVSMGIYLFSRDVLIDAIMENSVLSDSHDIGGDVMPALARSGLLHAYDFRNEQDGSPRYWRDVGTLDAYYRANLDLLGSPPVFVFKGPNGEQLELAENDTEAHVERCILSRGVRIGQGADVSDCILYENAQIGRGAMVRGAIIEEGVAIPEGMKVGYDRSADIKRFTVSPGGIVVIDRTVQWDTHPARASAPGAAGYGAAELIVHG
jgi:glucose-1-phosphate adenylyltransferase